MSRTVAHATESLPKWSGLYRTGAVAALLMAVFIPIQIVVLVMSPPPTTVAGWFTLFQRSPILGLLDADVLLVVDQVLLGLVFLAVYMVLKDASPSAMLLALAAGLVGVTTYFASGAALEMLSLSGQYAAATTEAQKTVLLAAGQATMAVWQGTAFDVAYMLEFAALLIIGIVMYRSRPLFGTPTAVTGVVLGALSVLPPTAGAIGLLMALASLVPLEVWDVLVARRLLALARGTGAAA